ncbi:hypothetical protein BCR34DRAFT_609240 [Clohesyomyces aquaticus]|uniref:Dehydrogenase/reductase SDR family member 8 n=1 Tax=Clohesyomyces aquaticus TaxID=1231657 RepID=A0A1Y1XUQ8_9PLEO|nr:hypothetical protein BCR34DRAFT_609240 [Clohesyomyces aquaticus]
MSLIPQRLKSTLEEPLLTGTLLYLLTLGPPHIRARLLSPLQSTLLYRDGAARVAQFITLLKALVAIGTLKRISGLLNRLALNNWSLRRQGAAFAFGPQKKELVLITGGSSGFGYEMVKGFARVARVVVVDVVEMPEELRVLSDVHFYRCDLADTSAIVSISQTIRQTHGAPSILINNAGIGIGRSVLETSNSECEKVFQVNLISHFALIREFLPAMLEMRKGHIVTIASMASFVATPGSVDYCCSKVAALYLSDGIRAECLTRYPNGSSICTTSVHPSWHATGIIKGNVKDLVKHGVVLDPPSNVSDRVVEQVLAGRSGRIYVPRAQEGNARLREWPLWAQDVVMGYVWKRASELE